MAKDENPRNYSTLTVSDVAELLSLTDRQVRNLIKDKGLPARSDTRGFTLDWPTALEWYVGYRSAQKPGNGGNRRPGNGSDGSEAPEETLDEAILRKTKAEADLKELQLAREQGQVVAIADIERVLANANRSIQTQILALPAGLAPQLIGMDDRQQIYNLIDRSCRSLLTNLAGIDAIREGRSSQPEPDEE